jgi:hypothetical protein
MVSVGSESASKAQRQKAQRTSKRSRLAFIAFSVAAVAVLAAVLVGATSGGPAHGVATVVAKARLNANANRDTSLLRFGKHQLDIPAGLCRMTVYSQDYDIRPNDVFFDVYGQPYRASGDGKSQCHGVAHPLAANSGTCPTTISCSESACTYFDWNGDRISLSNGAMFGNSFGDVFIACHFPTSSTPTATAVTLPAAPSGAIQPCSPSLRSRDGGPSTEVEFNNTTPGPVGLYKLDTDGTPHVYLPIQGNQTVRVAARGSEYWEVLDGKIHAGELGRCLMAVRIDGTRPFVVDIK